VETDDFAHFANNWKMTSIKIGERNLASKIYVIRQIRQRFLLVRLSTITVTQR
jgi:hypothetical protein